MEHNYSDELRHHGIKGQKWGIRRYQTKDGSLTPAGKKRYDKDMAKLKEEKKILDNKKRTAAKLKKLEDMKKQVEDEKAALEGTSKKPKKQKGEAEPKKKSISEMTDEELFTYNQRLNMEKNAYELQKRLSELNPKPTPPAQALFEKAGPIVAQKLWEDIGKKQINSFLEKQLGIKDAVSEAEKLRKEASIWENKEKIARAKKNVADDTEKYQKGQERRAKEASDRKSAEEAAKRAEKEAKKAEKEAKKAEKRSKYEEQAEQEIFGEGTSRFTGFDKPPTKDAVWDGQRYVDELLMLPGPNDHRRQ